jgi:hypothetical protein
MGQGFKEKAHLNIDQDAFKEGHERIFGNKSNKERVMDNRKENILKVSNEIVVKAEELQQLLDDFAEAYPEKEYDILADQIDKVIDKLDIIGERKK